MYTIYSYANPQYMAHVFNAIAMLNEKGFITLLMQLTGTVGLLGAVWQMAVNQQFKKPLIVASWLLIVVAFFGSHNASVMVKNVGNPLLMKRVDNVPLALAVIASAASNVGYHSTRIFELSFSHVGDHSSYAENGMLFGAGLLKEASQMRINDPDFKQNMQSFVQNCVIFDALSERQDFSLKKLLETQDVWGLVSANPSTIFGIKYKQGSDRVFKTCAETARDLESKWAGETRSATSFLAKKFGKVTEEGKVDEIGKVAVLQHLPIGNQIAGDASSGAANSLRQDIMINTLKDSTANKLNSLGGGAAIQAKSMHAMYSAFINFGQMAANNLPLFSDILNSTLYGAFCIIFLFMITPTGYKYVISYAGILLWIQTWPIFFSITNLILETGLDLRMKDEGITILNQSSVISSHDMMLAMAGYLSFLTPYISYMAIKGGAGSFMHLSSTFMNPGQSASMQAAGEVSSGNMSLGNISMDNKNMMNHSAFKTNTNLAHSSGAATIENDRGMSMTETSGGKSIFTGQNSRLNTSIDHSSGTMQHMQDRQSIESTQGTEMRNQFTESESSFKQTNVDFAQRIADEQRRQDALGSGHTVSNDQNVTNMIREYNNASDNTSTNVDTSINGGAEAHIGKDGVLFGGRIHGGINHTSSDSDQISNTTSHEKMNDLAKMMAQNDSVFNNLDLSRADAQTKELANSWSESYSTMKERSESLAKFESEQQVTQNAIEHLKTNGLGTTEALTQECKEWGAKNFNMADAEVARLLEDTSMDNPQAASLKSDILKGFYAHKAEQVMSNERLKLNSNFANERQALGKAEMQHAKDNLGHDVRERAHDNGIKTSEQIDQQFVNDTNRLQQESANRSTQMNHQEQIAHNTYKKGLDTLSEKSKNNSFLGETITEKLPDFMKTDVVKR